MARWFVVMMLASALLGCSKSEADYPPDPEVTEAKSTLERDAGFLATLDSDTVTTYLLELMASCNFRKNVNTCLAAGRIFLKHGKANPDSFKMRDAISYFQHACEYGSDIGCKSASDLRVKLDAENLRTADDSNIHSLLNYCKQGDGYKCYMAGKMHVLLMEKEPSVYKVDRALEYFQDACRFGSIFGCKMVAVINQTEKEKAVAIAKRLGGGSRGARPPAETSSRDWQDIAKRLGGGFRGAQWGMTKEQVKIALAGDVKGEESNALEIMLDSGQSATCRFSNDRLRKVVFNPHLGDRDIDKADALLSQLTKQYGKGEDVEGLSQVFGWGRFPLLATKWEDSETTVMWLVQRPSETLPYTASTTKVVYESKLVKD